MHNSDKTQIWISTYKYPKNANSTYALEYEYGRIFREEKEVELIGVSSEWKTSPYSVFVYYKIPSENGRAKLMTTLMDTSKKTTMYYFTPKLGQQDGYVQFQEIYRFGVDGLYYLYAGTTNFIVGTGTQNTVGVDWSQSAGRKFGFMMVWSHNAICRTTADNDNLDFGEAFV